MQFILYYFTIVCLMNIKHKEIYIVDRFAHIADLDQ